MATRQYIGARYTIKVYENSLDPSSAEWEAGTAYEPITMVTYNNSSYLSKKEVSNTIGNPADNPSYWVLTGAYNGQIAYLQEQINEIKNTLVSPEMFGAVGDGVADDTEAVQAAAEAAMITGKLLLLTNTYLVNTIWIHDPITIMGGGTVKTPKFRYETLTSAVDDNTRHFTSAHPEYYHVNTLFTIYDGSLTVSAVVTQIVGNEIYFAPTYEENASDFINSEAIGANIRIHKLAFYVGHDIAYAAGATVLKNVIINDLHFEGDQSGYDLGGAHILDTRHNGFISSFNLQESEISGCTFDTCNSSALCMWGAQKYNRIVNNAIKNVHSADPNNQANCGGITFHYDGRMLPNAYQGENCVIQGNIIDDVYRGIFLSSTINFIVADNIVRNVVNTGITVYHGDYGFTTQYNNVTGNNVITCQTDGDNTTAAIEIRGGSRCGVKNNRIEGCINAIHNTLSTQNTYEGNEILGFTGYGFMYSSGGIVTISDNYFSEGAGVCSIYIDDSQSGASNRMYITNNKYVNLGSLLRHVDIEQHAHVVIDGDLHDPTTGGGYECKINTANIAQNAVICRNCNVGTNVAGTSTERDLMMYSNCVDSTNTIQSNAS